MKVLALYTGRSSSSSSSGFSTVSEQLYLRTLPPSSVRAVGFSQHLSALDEARKFCDESVATTGPVDHRSPGLTLCPGGVGTPAGG